MTGNPRFAFDCRRRFLESYGSVVLGMQAAVFQKQHDIIMTMKISYCLEQLRGAAEGVYDSWVGERTYRRLQRPDDLKGTAVTRQAMVFGNGSSLSGAGVAFSRDPSTGDNTINY
jgi:pyruvate,orthophosphate dikinase